MITINIITPKINGYLAQSQAAPIEKKRSTTDIIMVTLLHYSKSGVTSISENSDYGTRHV